MKPYGRMNSPLFHPRDSALYLAPPTGRKEIIMMKPRVPALFLFAAVIAFPTTVTSADGGKLSNKSPTFLCTGKIFSKGDVQKTNCSALDEFSFSLEAVPAGEGSGGPGPPEIETSQLKIVKRFDSRSLLFLQSLLNGAPLEDLELVVTQDDGATIKFKFELAVVRGMEFLRGESGAPLSEDVLFEVAEISVVGMPISKK